MPAEMLVLLIPALLGAGYCLGRIDWAGDRHIELGRMWNQGFYDGLHMALPRPDQEAEREGEG